MCLCALKRLTHELIIYQYFHVLRKLFIVGGCQTKGNNKLYKAAHKDKRSRYTLSKLAAGEKSANFLSEADAFTGFSLDYNIFGIWFSISGNDVFNAAFQSYWIGDRDGKISVEGFTRVHGCMIKSVVWGLIDNISPNPLHLGLMTLTDRQMWGVLFV